MFNTNIFGNSNSKDIKADVEKAEIVFVSDLYIDDYVGGAEITSENLIKKIELAGKKIAKIKSSEVNLELIEAGINSHWVFFNYAGMDLNLIPALVANIKYSIVEYDYKFCKYRSTEKHYENEQKECDCHKNIQGKIISAFMYGSENLMWMSESQRNFYFKIFPFLEEKNNHIISSAFSKETLDKLSKNRKNRKRIPKALIIGSNSWIKGVEDSVKYCESKEIEFDIIQNITHDEVIKKMGEYEHFVFMPKGKDTCPRILIEAKLSGMNIHCNIHCQHTTEKWWGTPEEVEDYMTNHPQEAFFNAIKRSIEKIETISGYTTTKDCISQQYPYKQAIKSMLGFCDQVVVVDGGSTDGTWEALVKLSKSDDRIIIEQKKRDWSHPRFAVFDGLQKAYARSLCTGDWCWQIDSDEVVHEKDYEKIKNLIKRIPKSIHLIALPVIEYWGSSEKVRIDVNPWKWRLSRNHKHITHGIPKQFRREDEEGNLYAYPGTDGCDYIDSNTFEIIPCMNFYSKDIHEEKLRALSGDIESLERYENWFNNAVENLPGVHHYSWMNLERKIKTYKNYWSKHWQSLYNIKQQDTIENNMFFDKKWKDVTEDDIKELAKQLKEKMGGWVFHKKINFDKTTPHAFIERSEPEIMNDTK